VFELPDGNKIVIVFVGFGDHLVQKGLILQVGAQLEELFEFLFLYISNDPYSSPLTSILLNKYLIWASVNDFLKLILAEKNSRKETFLFFSHPAKEKICSTSFLATCGLNYGLAKTTPTLNE
jgi:hypothetical protein